MQTRRRTAIFNVLNPWEEEMGLGAPISRTVAAEEKTDLKTEVNRGQTIRKICKRQTKSTLEELEEIEKFKQPVFLMLLQISSHLK